MAVALLALVVAMSGTAVAATLINGANIKKDTVTGKQVKESSLAAVPKAKGLTPAKSGQTMSGVFSGGSGLGTIGAAGGYIGVGVTYPQPLSTPVKSSHIVDIKNSNYTDKCPGEGQAAKGYLCLYNTIPNGVSDGYGYSSGFWTNVNGKSVGAILYWNIDDNDEPYVGGTWTVKAP
jgi:hypothetical protein